MDKNAYIEKFLKKMSENKYSYTTIRTYRYPLKRFSIFLDDNGGMSFQDVTPEVLEKYRLDLMRSDLAGESVTTYLQGVRKLFSYLEDEGFIFANPAENFLNPRLKSKIKQVPTIDDMDALLSVINTETLIGIRDRAMIETAYCCALRMNEILKLTIFNVDLDNMSLRVIGKGKKERVLPLGKEAVKWLKTYLEKSRPHLTEDKECSTLWLNKDGNPLLERTYQRMLQYHAARAGLGGRISGHTMRRACATHMLRNGAHPVAVQHMLGHASLNVLGQYLNLSLHELQKAHEKSKLGR